MRKLNSILEEFNVTCSQLDIEHTYSLSEVLSPDSDFWSVSTTKAVQGIVPWSMQRNICQAFLTVKRTEEEVCLLQEEMKQVIKYWKAHQEKLRCLIEKYECEDDFNRGAKALLHKLLWEADMNLSKATAAFSPILLSELSTIPISESEEESDDDSDDCNDTEL